MTTKIDRGTGPWAAVAFLAGALAQQHVLMRQRLQHNEQPIRLEDGRLLDTASRGVCMCKAELESCLSSNGE